MGQLKPILETYNVSALIHMMDTLRLRRDDTLRKAGMVAQLASFLGQRQHVAAIERRLSARQWQTLAYPRLREGPVPLSSLQVRLRAQGASAAQAAAELEGLLASGCLLFVEQPLMKEKLDPTQANLLDGRYSDLRLAAFPDFLDEAKRRSAGVDLFGWVASAPTQPRLGSFVDVQRDAYLALRAAAEGQIRLTAKGVPFKVDATRLAAASAGQAPRVKGGKKSADVTVPPRLWLVLAALMASDLTEAVESKLVPRPAAGDFLRAPAAEQAKRLYACWLDCVFSEFFRVPGFELAYPVDRGFAWVDPSVQAYGVSDLPTWPRLKQARRSVVRAIQQGAAGRASEWLSVATLCTTIRADDPEFLVPARPQAYGYSSYYYGGRRPRNYEGLRRPGRKYPDNQFRRDEDWDEVEGAYVAQVLLEPLFWLGLVDLGQGAEGKLASFRLTPIGRHVLLDEPLPEEAQPATSGPPLVVQPNFDLVVMDAPANLGLLAQLDDFAERATLDRAATYKLSREAVVRGLERGLTGQAILSFLEGASRAPVPQNIRYSIEEWARLYERIHLRSGAILLVADSAAQLQRWQQDRHLGGLLGRQLSPTAILVPAEQRGSLEALLARRGEASRVVDYRQPQRRLFRVSEPAEVEVLAKHDEPFVRYRLARFADLAQDTDRRVRFVLTAESVRRAVAAGQTADDVVDYLRSAAVGEVPADTILRVRGWAGSYGALRYQPAVAVEAPYGLTWADLGVVPAVREAVVGTPTPRVTLVAPARFEAMRAALTERGLKLEAGLKMEAEPPTTRPPTVGEPASSEAGLPPDVMRMLGGMARSALGKSASDEEVALMQEMLGMRLTNTAGPPPSDDAEPVLLKRPSEVELRTLLEDAIRRKRRIFIGQVADDGTRVAVSMRPVRLGKSGRDYYVDAYCDECEKVHRLRLDEITGVGEVDRRR